MGAGSVALILAETTFGANNQCAATRRRSLSHTDTLGGIRIEQEGGVGLARAQPLFKSLWHLDLRHDAAIALRARANGNLSPVIELARLLVRRNLQN